MAFSRNKLIELIMAFGRNELIELNNVGPTKLIVKSFGQFSLAYLPRQLFKSSSLSSLSSLALSSSVLLSATALSTSAKLAYLPWQLFHQSMTALACWLRLGSKTLPACQRWLIVGSLALSLAASAVLASSASSASTASAASKTTVSSTSSCCHYQPRWLFNFGGLSDHCRLYRRLCWPWWAYQLHQPHWFCQPHQIVGLFCLLAHWFWRLCDLQCCSNNCCNCKLICGSTKASNMRSCSILCGTLR